MNKNKNEKAVTEKVVKTLASAGLGVASFASASVSVMANQTTAPTFVDADGNEINNTNNSVVQTVMLGTTDFDPMAGIFAIDTDEDDNMIDLTGDITYEVLSAEFLEHDGSIVLNRHGELKIKYTAVDAYGNTSTLTVGHLVVGPLPEIELAEGASLVVMKDSVFTRDTILNQLNITDGNGNDIKANAVITGNVDTSQLGHQVVEVSITNDYDRTVTMDVTFYVAGEPTIEHNGEKIIDLNAVFNPMDGLVATDDIGTDITNEVVIVSNDVDTSVEGDYQVVYRITDGYGNTKTLTVDFIVKESLMDTPKIEFTGEQVIIKGSAGFDVKNGIKATDGQGVDLTSQVAILGTVDTTTAGEYSVKYTVFDRQGQSFELTVEFVVIEPDVTPPTIDASAKVIEVGESFDPMAGVTATDDRDGNVDVVLVSGSVDTTKVGNYTLVYRATDSSGNFVEKTITIAVVDVTPPTLGLKGSAETTLDYGAVVDLKSLFNFSDNYYPNNELTFTIVQGIDTTKSGVQTVMVEVVDGSGNKSELSVEFIVKAKPNTAPKLTGSNKEVYVGKEFDLMKGIVALDNEDGDITSSVVIESNNVNVNKVGVYNVTYAVTDADGAVTRLTIQVTVMDGTAPIISANNIHVSQGKSFNYMLGLTGAQDNVDGNITSRVAVRGEVNVDVPGEYRLTYSVSDKAGNVSEKSITVFVHDKDIETEDGSPALFVGNIRIIQGNKFNPLAGVAAIDQFDGDVTDNIKVSGDVNTDRAGVYEITYTVTNERGLTASRTVKVEVVSTADANVDSSPDAVYEKVATFVDTPTVSLFASASLGFAGLLSLFSFKKKKK